LNFQPYIDITLDKNPRFAITALAGIQQSIGCRSKIPSLARINSGRPALAIYSPGYY
jgi:hypothetical protein